MPVIVVYFVAAFPLNLLLFRYKRQRLKDFLKKVQTQKNNKKYLFC